VLWLLGVGGLLLTLSRLLAFEASYPNTADQFSESTVPWALFVVLPLVAAAGLLVLGRDLTWALPVGLGLVLGGALVLVEHAVFWGCYFVENRSSFTAGPALWCLFGGAVAVAAAGIVGVIRSALAGRAPLRTDWRVACALVVVACVVWFLVAGPEPDTSRWWWFALYEGTLLLGVAALPITLLWLRAEQRIAALVAITLFGAWSVYFIVREIVAPQLGYESSVWVVELVSVVLTVLACYAAQAGPARRETATPPPPR
jgi:hypothetical protein